MADESSYSICNVAWDNYFQDDLIDPTIQFEIGVATITTTGPNGMNYLSTVQFVPDSMTWQQILDADVQSHSIDVVINGSYVRPWSVTYVPEGTSSVNVDVIPESGYFDYAFSGGSELVPGYNALTVKANNGHILLYQIYVGGAVDSGIVIPPAPTPTPTQQIVYMTPNIDIKNVSSPNTLMAEILNDVLNVHLSMASITNAKQFEVAVSLDGKNWFSRLETPAQPTSKNQQFAIPGFSNVKELQVKVRTVSENAQSIWTDVVTWKAATLLKPVGKKITANLNTNSANLSLATRAKLIQELMTQKLWTQKSAIVSYSVAGLAKRQKAFLLSQVRELVSLLKLGDYSIKTKVIQSKKPPALIISMTGLH
jgi:hypothetical protein